MASPANPDTAEVTGGGSRPGPALGMPRWVKVFLIIAIVLAVAFVVSLLAGVRHGPDLHTPAGSDTPPMEQGP